jgi:3-phosphoinositide dependent protein kinase-1
MKPSNVLINKTYDLKITDFGTAKIFNCKDQRILKLITVREDNESTEQEKIKEKGTFVGTHEYISPESLNSEAPTPMVDIWGLGIMVYEMINGHTPFKGATEMLTYLNISEGTIKFRDDIDPIAKDFIIKLLHQDPKERLGFNNKENWIDYKLLRSHEFFKDIDFNNIDPTQIEGLISGKRKKTSRSFAEMYSEKRHKISQRRPKNSKINSECYSTMDSSTNTKFIISLNELR